jgi:hypothetical protein
MVNESTPCNEWPRKVHVGNRINCVCLDNVQSAHLTRNWLHVRATLSDAEFAALSVHYDVDQILEIIQLCGYYRTVSYLANALALLLETTAARFPT